MGCGEHYAASALWVCGECEYALGRGGTILCADTVNTLTAIHHSATWLKYHCPTHIWFESLHHTKTNEISKTIQKHFSLLSRHFPCNLHLTPGHGNVLTYNLGLWILILKPKQKRALKRGHFFSRNRMCSNLQCNRSSLPNTVFISHKLKKQFFCRKKILLVLLPLQYWHYPCLQHNSSFIFWATLYPWYKKQCFRI